MVPLSKDRFKQVTGVFLILRRANQILLARRFQTGYGDGEFSFPAGHLEEGESILTALVRESKEEIGVTIDPFRCHFVHVLHLLTNRASTNFFFEVKEWDGVPTICEPDKCDELRWVDIDDLPDNTIDYIREVIDCYKNQISYHEIGWE
ncbi:NUDIX hydrolase [Candidatus Cerribacteria bacterium 'Amazon FNV 2010 28 9']|uniref:NUDIX hydrolase n=1 Tax=Candidatus Cerribacteria bacterium 'Amazon FNV 2010 28 9' TaxID=2081795 RepID=A0A317JUF5_9BACT|nr:MAG: NUDIX hydrolase [Candidatus Cerribacteria bacterium 'Amazon FNV 2010 28 9']